MIARIGDTWDNGSSARCYRVPGATCPRRENWRGRARRGGRTRPLPDSCSIIRIREHPTQLARAAVVCIGNGDRRRVHWKCDCVEQQSNRKCCDSPHCVVQTTLHLTRIRRHLAIYFLPLRGESGQKAAWRELCRIIRHLGSANQIDAAMVFAQSDFVNVDRWLHRGSDRFNHVVFAMWSAKKAESAA